MRKIVYILIMNMAGLSVLLGQSKVAPPPTKITLPSDTTSIQHQQEAKIKTDDSQIELPDVLILGKDRILRKVGGKGNLVPERPRLVRPGDVYKPVSIWFKGETEKPYFKDEISSVKRISWGGVQAGAYTTMLMDAGHWRKHEKGDFRVHGWLDRSNNEFNNSQYGQGGLAGKFSHELAPRVTGTLKANYNMYRRGLHGATINDFTRRAGSGSFGANLEYDVNKLSDGKLGFEIGGSNVTSDTSKVRFNYTSDSWYKLFYGYTAQLWKLQFETTGQYTRETLEFLADSLRFKSSFAEIGIELLAPVGRSFAVAAGASYQSAARDSFTADSKIAPFLRINFMPGNKVGLTGHLYNRLEYLTYSEWWQNNPYMNHLYSQRAQDVKFGLDLDLDYQLLPALQINGRISRKWMNRLYFWERDSVTQLINLNELNNHVRLTEFQIGANLQLSDRTTFQVEFISYSDKLDSISSVSAQDRIPYRPDYRIPLRAAVQLLSDMLLTVEADIYGERRSQLNSSQRLPSFGLMNAQLSKDFGDIFTAVVSVRNLLDSDFVVWENYPETGVTLLGGIRARF